MASGNSGTKRQNRRIRKGTKRVKRAEGFVDEVADSGISQATIQELRKRISETRKRVQKTERGKFAAKGFAKDIAQTIAQAQEAADGSKFRTRQNLEEQAELLLDRPGRRQTILTS